jgi:hypothetical protein
METGEVDPWFRHQSRQAGDEIQWIEDDVGGAVAVRRLVLGRSCASMRP